MTTLSSNPELNLLDIINQEDKNELQYQVKQFSKNEYIYMPDRKANYIFIVKEGRVKIGTEGSDNKEIIKKVAIKGELFGAFAFMEERTHSDYCIAMEDSEVYILAKDAIQLLMRNHANIGLYLMRVMANELVEMESRLTSLIFKSSRIRIVEFLEKLISKRGQRVGYEMLVRKFFTHQEIANLTATSRQTVTTVLNDLRNKNILTFNRRRLLIRNMDLLRAEAA